MRILQVSYADRAGGAEKVAYKLFREYRLKNHRSWLAVGHKRSDDPDVLTIINDAYRSRWARTTIFLNRFLSSFFPVRYTKYLTPLLNIIGQPSRMLDIRQGKEDFDFPGTWHILNLFEEPDIVHFHNLHKEYFDLRVLPRISEKLPTILTLHDAWLLSGHCAHSFSCERWKIGCGKCPDLNIYPAIKRDATAYNWQRKRDIYAKSHLYITTPCNWLMKKVEQSILAPAIMESRVIPNGIDLTVFRPGDKETARATLGLPQDRFILLFVGHGTYSNPWKDYLTMETALEKVSKRNRETNLLLLCLGEERREEEMQMNSARIRFIAYQKNPALVAQFYQAADTYLHAAKADTFPNTILESLACGTPVVATAVGGIPEIVKDGKTGFLVPPRDPVSMADKIEILLKNKKSRDEFAENAAEDAKKRFDLNHQVKEYLKWYEEIIERAN